MKLYIGNLPWSVDQNGLKELFASYGADEATLIQDKFSGRSKGFGFVTISDDEAAKKAISEMNDKEIEGRPIKVSEARPMESRDAPRGNSEAPMADSSEINDEVEENIEENKPEVVDDNSDAEEGEEDIETADEAIEDAESDK